MNENKAASRYLYRMCWESKCRHDSFPIRFHVWVSLLASLHWTWAG